MERRNFINTAGIVCTGVLAGYLPLTGGDTLDQKMTPKDLRELNSFSSELQERMNAHPESHSLAHNLTTPKKVLSRTEKDGVVELIFENLNDEVVTLKRNKKNTTFVFL